MTRFELTTERALLLGRGAADHDLFSDYLASRNRWETVDLPPVYERPDHSAPMYDAPVLDIRVLARSKEFRRDNVTAQTLGWPLEYTEDHDLLMVRDPRGEVPIIMIAHQLERRDEPRWQRIEIAQLSNGRARFVCPISEKRCDLLYWRNGSFASWVMQRLYHPSQRKLRGGSQASAQ